MTPAEQLLSDLRKRGLTVSLVDGEGRVAGGKLTATDKRRLGDLKEEVKAVLRCEQWTDADPVTRRRLLAQEDDYWLSRLFALCGQRYSELDALYTEAMGETYDGQIDAAWSKALAGEIGLTECRAEWDAVLILLESFYAGLGARNNNETHSAP